MTPDELLQLSRFANAGKMHKQFKLLASMDRTAYDVLKKFFRRVRETRAQLKGEEGQ